MRKASDWECSRISKKECEQMNFDVEIVPVFSCISQATLVT
jgi:hypothetical protein